MSDHLLSNICVVDANVAVYGSIDVSAFDQHTKPIASASASVLARASFHGVEMHVPSLFLSEVTTLIYENFVALDVVSLEDGKHLLGDVLSPTWEYHFPVVEDVLEMQYDLGDTEATSDAEYLSLAMNLNCTFISADNMLVEQAQKLSLPINVVHVTDHPWAQTGALEDFPPGS
jgi:predicted nucleic acid-binding protein